MIDGDEMSDGQNRPRPLIELPAEEWTVELSIDPRDEPELYDLASIQFDLQIARGAASVLATTPEREPHVLVELDGLGREEAMLLRASWEGAIAAYSRCFEQGQGASGLKRATLHAMVAALDPELQETDRTIRHMRGKEVGHHVASAGFQQVEVFVGRRALGTGSSEVTVVVGLQQTSLDRRLSARLASLAAALQERVSARMIELQDAALACRRPIS